jgi:alkylated DNA repair dioxygenase AlkB
VEDQKALEDWVKVSPISERQEALVKQIVATLPKDLEMTKRPFPSKRGQGTFGWLCEKKNYSFSGLLNPIRPASEPMQELIKAYAEEVGVPTNRVMLHVNDYPEGTAAGCGAHRDLEHIDQTKPIHGFQCGAPAKLCVWHGEPKVAAERHGAKLEIKASDMYRFLPGMQQVTAHAIERKKGPRRVNITLRVCDTEPIKSRKRPRAESPDRNKSGLI